MRISHSTAMRIVTELSDIIRQSINLMDENGVVIASTDEKRIGTVHEGSQKLMEEHLEVLIINSDDEYPGSRQGVNFPVEMDGRYIGAIGITGDYEVIREHGRIIKKMTEILLLDDYLKEQKRLKQNLRTGYIQEWVLDPAAAGQEAFVRRGLSLDIDVRLPRRAVMLLPLTDVDDTLEWQRLLERTEKALRRAVSAYPQALVICSGKKLICLLPDWGDRRLLNAVEAFQAGARQEPGVELAAGLDSRAAAGGDMPLACQRAEKALYGSVSHPEHRPIFYRELRLEILVHEIPAALRAEYVERTFQNCTPEEREGYAQMLKVFYACNGSIQQAAERLFLHKNTLQYKLNKLSGLTGINPRTYQGGALYCLALAFLEEERLGNWL